MLRATVVSEIAGQLGARVLPVRVENGRKRALLKRWPERATADPEIITSIEWRERWRAANAIGVTLDNLIVVDFDPPQVPQHPGPPLAQAVAAFEADLGAELPAEAFRQQTRSGGLHVVCRAPACPVWRGVGFRRYDGLGQVDIKAGPDNLIVITPSPGYRFLGGTPSLRPADLPPLPAAITEALRDHAPERTGLKADQVCVEHWAGLVATTQHYRPLPKTARLLLADCRWLATAPEGKQEAVLNALGFKWGSRVARRYIGAERVLRSLTNAGMAMVNYRPAEPWTRPEVEAKLRDAILEGYAHAL